MNEPQQNSNESLKGYRNQTVSNFYRFFLDESIGEPSYYRDLISTLYDASEYDIVELHINTPGGRMDTCTAICDALKATKASTTALVTCAYSAGSAIMLACENVIVFPSTAVMVHQASWGNADTHQNIKIYTDFFDKQHKKYMLDNYQGFLTDKELTDLVDNQKEFWMDSDEVVLRLEKRQKVREAKVKKSLKKVQE